MKKFKKNLSLALAILMCVNTMMMPAAAAEERVENEDGSVTVTVTVVNEDKSTTVTETTSKETAPAPVEGQPEGTTVITKTETVETETTFETDASQPSTTPVGPAPTAEVNSELSKEQTDITPKPTPGALTEQGKDWTDGSSKDSGMTTDDTTDYSKKENNDLTKAEGSSDTTNNADIQLPDYLDGDKDVTLSFTAPGTSDREQVAFDQAAVDQYLKDNNYSADEKVSDTGSVTTQTGKTETVKTETSDAESTGLQEIEELKVGETSKTEGNTTETVKITNNNNVYNRVTTSVTKTSENISENLTDAEKEALAVADKVEETITYKYLEAKADTETTKYTYTYAKNADGSDDTSKILSITKVETIKDEKGNILSVKTDVEEAEKTVTTVTTKVDPTTKNIIRETTVTEEITERFTKEGFQRTVTESLERVDTVTSSFNASKDTFQLDPSSLFTDSEGNMFYVYEGTMYEVEEVAYSTTGGGALVGDWSPNKDADFAGNWTFNDKYNKGYYTGEGKFATGQSVDGKTTYMFRLNNNA